MQNHGTGLGFCRSTPVDNPQDGGAGISGRRYGAIDVPVNGAECGEYGLPDISTVSGAEVGHSSEVMSWGWFRALAASSGRSGKDPYCRQLPQRWSDDAVGRPPRATTVEL